MTGENPQEMKYCGNDLHYGKNGQVLAGVDDLIQLIGGKVKIGRAHV